MDDKQRTEIEQAAREAAQHAPELTPEQYEELRSILGAPPASPGGQQE